MGAARRPPSRRPCEPLAGPERMRRRFCVLDDARRQGRRPAEPDRGRTGITPQEHVFVLGFEVVHEIAWGAAIGQSCTEIIDAMDQLDQPSKAPVVEMEREAGQVWGIVVTDFALGGLDGCDLSGRHDVTELVVEDGSAVSGRAWPSRITSRSPTYRIEWNVQ